MYREAKSHKIRKTARKPRKKRALPAADVAGLQDRSGMAAKVGGERSRPNQRWEAIHSSVRTMKPFGGLSAELYCPCCSGLDAPHSAAYAAAELSSKNRAATITSTSPNNKNHQSQGLQVHHTCVSFGHSKEMLVLTSLASA